MEDCEDSFVLFGFFVFGKVVFRYDDIVAKIDDI
jgi:hypothetical protein